MSHRIETIDQLETLYGEPVAPAIAKELDHLSTEYQAFIRKSPFLMLATVGPEGLDCSPRGDPNGFVRIVDERTVMFADRRGNNRADSLRNIVRDARVSLLFMIPGIGETLRINGRAELSVEPALLDSFVFQGKAPRSVVVVAVDRVYFQCQKAVVRANLWEPEAYVAREDVPTAGEMLQAAGTEPFDAARVDNPEHLKKTLY